MDQKVMETNKEFLKTYNASKYEKPSVTVDMLIFTVDISGELELLLIKRKKPPFQDCWAIPGGFVNMDESLDEAARRELKEETNIDNVYLEQLYTFGAVNRDPRTRVISVAYLALISKDKLDVRAGDDAADAKWYKVKLEENKLLFDKDIELAFDHEDVVKLAIERMRGKLNYTNIGFSLLDDQNRFTIYELQKIYEAILNKSLDTANFRRYFIKTFLDKGIVSKTGEKCEKFSRRPSHYYSYEG